MSTVDWVLLACVLASMLLGAWRGLVYEVLSLLGWLVAFVVARIWAADVALWLPMQDWDMQLRYAAGFVLLFVLALFGWGLVSWLSRRLIEAATGGAERFEGRMIEAMHVEEARALVARAEAVGQ